MFAKFARKFREFRDDRSGASLIELGFAMPVLLMLLLGGVEIARYVLLHQKLDRVSSSIADLVSQAELVSVADLQNIFDAAQFVAKPFDLPALGTVIVSSITNPGRRLYRPGSFSPTDRQSSWPRSSSTMSHGFWGILPAPTRYITGPCSVRAMAD